MNKNTLRGEKAVGVVFFFFPPNKSTENLVQNFKGLLCFVSQFLAMPQLKTCKKAKTSRRCLMDVTVGHICLVRILETLKCKRIVS